MYMRIYIALDLEICFYTILYPTLAITLAITLNTLKLHQQGIILFSPKWPFIIYGLGRVILSLDFFWGGELVLYLRNVW